jgi:hypothetical protein
MVSRIARNDIGPVLDRFRPTSFCFDFGQITAAAAPPRPATPANDEDTPRRSPERWYL